MRISKITSFKETRSITLKDFLRLKKDGGMFEDMRQSAKCFTRGTQILTNKGYIKIEDLAPSVNLGEHTPFSKYHKEDIKAMFLGKEYTIASTYYGEDNDFIEFELEDGSRVPPVTHDHGTVVLRDSEQIELRAEEVLLTDKFLYTDINLEVKSIGIQNIDRIRTQRMQEVYCLSVPETGRVQIKVGNKNIIICQSINFGMLFGMAAKTFATHDLEVSWDEERVNKYIQDNNLQDSVDTMIDKFGKKHTLIQCKYIACAKDIREKFFKTYPGLWERIERERRFAKDKCYVRSWSGHTRKFPELRFVTFNDKGEPTGDNYQLYSKLFSSYANMMANATVQNWEAYLVMSSINEIQDWLKSTNKKSFIFNTVHDSIDMAIEKTELKEVCEKVSEICSRPRKNSFGMPQKVDITISDLTQGQYYKAGKDWKNFL